VVSGSRTVHGVTNRLILDFRTSNKRTLFVGKIKFFTEASIVNLYLFFYNFFYSFILVSFYSVSLGVKLEYVGCYLGAIISRLRIFSHHTLILYFISYTIKNEFF
jgi:hypothetical protein